MTGQIRSGQDRTGRETEPGRGRGRDCFSSTHDEYTREVEDELRCGRGCELFLNRSRKQACLSALSFLGWTLDSAGLYQCISCGRWRYVPQTMHGSAICWTCSEGGLACVPYFFHVPADTEGRSERGNAYVPYCDSGWAGACAGKVQATGTGDWGLGGRREGKREGGPLALGTGNGDPPGPRQKMWIGNGSSWPFRPSGPQGPLFSVLSGSPRP